MRTSESIKSIATALAKFQEEVTQPFKSANNPFFKSKYVPLENVVETINQYGPKNGLSFTQWPSVNEQGRIGVSTLLMHSSGEWIEYDPIYMKSEKDTAQGAGSVITYLKRYSLSAVYGITSDEDDDGNDASTKGKTKPTVTDKEKATLKAKWLLIGGKENVFNNWVAGEMQKGLGFQQIDEFLTTKVFEAKEEEVKDIEQQHNQS